MSLLRRLESMRDDGLVLILKKILPNQMQEKIDYGVRLLLKALWPPVEIKKGLSAKSQSRPLNLLHSYLTSPAYNVRQMRALASQLKIP